MLAWKGLWYLIVQKVTPVGYSDLEIGTKSIGNLNETAEKVRIDEAYWPRPIRGDLIATTYHES